MHLRRSYGTMLLLRGGVCSFKVSYSNSSSQVGPNGHKNVMMTLDLVPEKVPWSGLVKTLSMKWSRELNSKFGLSHRAINFLGQKIFRGHAFTDDTLVTWSMFNRENMPGRTFTFWQWFDSVMALMKHKLCVNYWNDHAVVGFIDRRECEQILQSQPHGTFLMRFSDSELGALSVSLTGRPVDSDFGNLFFLVCKYVQRSNSTFETTNNERLPSQAAS